jgi:hypothetical protein
VREKEKLFCRLLEQIVQLFTQIAAKNYCKIIAFLGGLWLFILEYEETQGEF